MIAEVTTDAAVARIASAIGEPARTRMLYCLLDGHARTSTELAMAGEVTPPTASAHLNRLRREGLVVVHAQGKHRYYALTNAHVARALETLSVVAGRPRGGFEPSTPLHYRTARSCYDHLAGRIAVSLFERFRTRRWIRARNTGPANGLELTREGAASLSALNIDLDAARALRRRFAYGCLDWSERRLHLAGALGAALLRLFMDRRWVERDLDSRALRVTSTGRRELRSRFELEF
jgi:DNA-binding transcriptional ArsR family regulator